MNEDETLAKIDVLLTILQTQKDAINFNQIRKLIHLSMING